MSKTTNDLTRLAALTQLPSRLTVDRTFPGRIKNVSILTTGPALGHGFEVDKTTVEQVARHAAGVRGRWTHGGLSDDGLGKHLGAWEHVRVETFRLCRACETETTSASEACPTCLGPTSEEHRAVGDFAFAGSAHRLRPDGLDVPAPLYLMERAVEDPQSLGISIVARLTYDEQKREGEERPRRLARVEAKPALRRADWVADPAANPVGLHAGTGTTSELTEAATRELDRLVERDGPTAAKLRALAFLSRYFGDDLTTEGELEALEAEVTSLRAKVASSEAALQERRRADDEAYLERLRTESAAAQAPIPHEDMERVAALLRAGQAETAKVVGEAFLARSKAQGQTVTRGDALPLSPPEKAQPAVKRSVEAQAHLLRGRGWTAEVNEDGTELTRAVRKTEIVS
jgi:hypothetical protein